MSKCVLLRVGVDAGCGKTQGPLFKDGTFEFMCIPDGCDIGTHTYGNMTGRYGRPLSHYFGRRSLKMHGQSVHLDPEFETFTYGDPTTPKSSLRILSPGDLLVFYCGLQPWHETKGWDRREWPGLYIVGYFKVAIAGIAADFTKDQLKQCAGNFHVKTREMFREQRDRLVLVKGGKGSRLLTKAHRLSAVGIDSAGRPLKILSPKMRKVFGDFGGKVTIQRSPPRWVQPSHVERAIEFVTGLE